MHEPKELRPRVAHTTSPPLRLYAKFKQWFKTPRVGIIYLIHEGVRPSRWPWCKHSASASRIH